MTGREYVRHVEVAAGPSRKIGLVGGQVSRLRGIEHRAYPRGADRRPFHRCIPCVRHPAGDDAALRSLPRFRGRTGNRERVGGQDAKRLGRAGWSAIDEVDPNAKVASTDGLAEAVQGGMAARHIGVPRHRPGVRLRRGGAGSASRHQCHEHSHEYERGAQSAASPLHSPEL